MTEGPSGAARIFLRSLMSSHPHLTLLLAKEIDDLVTTIEGIDDPKTRGRLYANVKEILRTWGMLEGAGVRAQWFAAKKDRPKPATEKKLKDSAVVNEVVTRLAEGHWRQPGKRNDTPNRVAEVIEGPVTKELESKGFKRPKPKAGDPPRPILGVDAIATRLRAQKETADCQNPTIDRS